jgi:hypothetical protein
MLGSSRFCQRGQHQSAILVRRARPDRSPRAGHKYIGTTWKPVRPVLVLGSKPEWMTPVNNIPAGAWRLAREPERIKRVNSREPGATPQAEREECEAGVVVVS